MRFYHTADIHFGVENYGRIDPKTGIHTRLLDFRDSLARVIDQAIQENIDFFLFSGDAYKTAHPTPTQQKLLVEQLLRLHTAGIPVLIIVGNHDHPLSFGKANSLDVFGYLPVEGFYVFSKPDLLKIQTKSGLVQIVGIPWPVRNNIVTNAAHHAKSHQEVAEYLSQQVGEIIRTLAQQADPTIPTVLAGHLTVSSGVFSGSEKCAIFGTDPIFLPSQLAIEPFDYVALGHLHRHQNLNPGGYPAVVYSGSIERVDFGERKEPKGFCAVTITQAPDNKKTIDPSCHPELDSGSMPYNQNPNKRTCTYEFIELPTRPMIQVEVVLKDGKDQTEQILEALEKHDLTAAIVKIIYHILPEKTDRVDLFAIQRACASAQYLVGIIPVYKPVTREKRASLTVAMDFSTLLDKYFDSKGFDEMKKAVLKEKALTLQHDELDPEGN